MVRALDAIVVGLGAAGSAATYQLAKRGKRVLGIDRYGPPHPFGSTHGDTRITRQAIGEGAHYTPFALRSYELFREVERTADASLLTVTGGLIISSDAVSRDLHVPGFFSNTVAAARTFGIRHDLLDATEIRRRFPQFSVKDNEHGYYEYEAGFLRPEACVTAHLELAAELGAEIRTNEAVVGFEAKNGFVSVFTEHGSYEAERVIISAGPWLPELLGEPLRRLFAVRRQVMHWFAVRGDASAFAPERFPIFIWQIEGSQPGFYGFPAIDGAGGGIKMATEQYEQRTTPGTVEREVSAAEAAGMHARCLEGRFADVLPEAVRSVTCLYTSTPDHGFVIDEHPDVPGVLIASPCSGHGFKHSAAVGEALAQIAIDGASELDVSRFSLKRFERGG
jgi:sarcosine oxidase